MSDTVILGAARTPIGAFLGGLAPVPAPKLGAIAIKCALERAGVRADEVDEVFMGNVVQAGVGQAPARQAALAAGIFERAGIELVHNQAGANMAGGVAAALLGATRARGGIRRRRGRPLSPRASRIRSPARRSTRSAARVSSR